MMATAPTIPAWARARSTSTRTPPFSPVPPRGNPTCASWKPQSNRTHMRATRPRLILQATGPEAAILRVIGHGSCAKIEPLIVARSASRQRDALALSDESVLGALRQCVAEHGLKGQDVVVVLGNAGVSCHR